MKKPVKKKTSDTSLVRPHIHENKPYHVNKSSNPQEKETLFSYMDKYYQASLGKITLGISPAALGTAYFSWLAQLTQSPGTVLELALYPLLHANDCASKLLCEQTPKEGNDVRFHTKNWKLYPWKLWAEQFLQIENWSLAAATDVPGLPTHVKRTVSFHMRQILDALSPSNFIFSNPDLLFNERF